MTINRRDGDRWIPFDSMVSLDRDDLAYRAEIRRHRMTVEDALEVSAR